MKIFARPAKLTEEEVTFHREQKICLVCKGKVGGFSSLSLICLSCEAIYCQKCATVLSNMENACWSCNAPIDESKPVKLVDKEELEESIEIVEELHKELEKKSN